MAFKIVLVPRAITAESTLCKRGDLGVGDGGSGSDRSGSGSGESKCELCKEPDDGKQSGNDERKLHRLLLLGDD